MRWFEAALATTTSHSFVSLGCGTELQTRRRRVRRRRTTALIRRTRQLLRWPALLRRRSRRWAKSILVSDAYASRTILRSWSGTKEAIFRPARPSLIREAGAGGRPAIDEKIARDHIELLAVTFRGSGENRAEALQLNDGLFRRAHLRGLRSLLAGSRTSAIHRSVRRHVTPSRPSSSTRAEPLHAVRSWLVPGLPRFASW